MNATPRHRSWIRRVQRLLVPALLGASLAAIAPLPARAQGSPPAQLTTLLNELEAAANRRDLEAVMAFYAEDFSTDDALDRGAVSAGLAKLWERYDNLTYTTELVDFSQQGDRLIAETVTEIRGVRNDNGRDVRLISSVRSRQAIANNQVTSQEILAERTQIFLGANPPTIDVSLPEQVMPGEMFNFDVIVAEPLGSDLLLGGALEESIDRDRYLEPSDFDLQLLQAGGIFKQGRAPEQPEDRWLSAIVIREDGITMVTQRLRVVSNTAGARQPQR